jgi:putative ABC transport system ATP-binding protein
MHAALVEVEAASRTYASGGGANHHALRGVSLRIHAGEFVAILGRSGSGKSTLLNLLAGLDRPDAGRIRIGGVDLGGLGENALAKWRARNVGIVFQFFQLMPSLTAAENVMLPMELAGSVPAAQRFASSMSLLERVGLAARARHLPSALSGGEQQRVALARALANAPPLLLADEPTGNLDSASAEAVYALLAALARKGTTVVIVTHDASLAAAAHRVLRLDDGAWVPAPAAVMACA